MDSTQTFSQFVEESHSIVVLTGAGVSAESGIPTFRGEGGLWRQYSAMELATPQAWSRDPVLVWQFYNYRREVVAKAVPNPAHYALAQWEQKLADEGKEFWLITQNIDDLHFAAGSQKVLPLHGSLWKVRCCECGQVREDRNVPITPGLGSENPQRKDLPRCPKCSGIERPHVVWFGESLDPQVLHQAQQAAEEADLFLVIGTSAVVYPAAGLVFLSKQRGAKVVEINLEPSGAQEVCDLTFYGRAGEILPSLLAGQTP